MKHEKLMYGIGSVAIIAGTVMKILHVPFGMMIVLLGFVWTSIFQTWHVAQLKKRIKELESNYSK